MAGRRFWQLNVALAVLLVVLAVVSLMVGPAGLSWRAALQGLFGGDGPAGIIVRDIRLPRTLLALAIGVVALITVAVQAGEQEQDSAAGSSFSPGPAGALALYLWLERGGFPVTRLEQAATFRERLREADVLWVLNPVAPYNEAQAQTVAEWVAAGGTLVLAAEGGEACGPGHQAHPDGDRADRGHGGDQQGEGDHQRSRSTIVATKLAICGAVPPIRTSPAAGSARNSMSLSPCRSSSKAA